MTVEAQIKNNLCPKCGSSMQYRRIKIASDELRLILQCQACRFYQENHN